MYYARNASGSEHYIEMSSSDESSSSSSSSGSSSSSEDEAENVSSIDFICSRRRNLPALYRKTDIHSPESFSVNTNTLCCVNHYAIVHVLYSSNLHLSIQQSQEGIVES